jgi:hypothetical protein
MSPSAFRRVPVSQPLLAGRGRQGRGWTGGEGGPGASLWENAVPGTSQCAQVRSFALVDDRCVDYRIGDGQEADGLADLLAAYDPSVTTKILRVTGVTVFAIIWALATVWAAMNIGYSVLEFVMTLWFD